MSAIGPAYTMSFVPHQQMAFLDKMAETCSIRSLEHIAVDPNTPVSTLCQLAGNQSEEVRIAVAENPSVTRELLVRLAKDEQDDVRFALAENSNLPVEILEILAVDCNPYVCDRANRSLMRKRSSRFTEKTERLNIANSSSINGRGLKRFVITLTNLARFGS